MDDPLSSELEAPGQIDVVTVHREEVTIEASDGVERLPTQHQAATAPPRRVARLPVVHPGVNQRDLSTLGGSDTVDAELC